MAKYGSGSYGSIKYGNANFITTITSDFKTAQAALARAPYSLLIVNSHFKQYGNYVTYPSTCYIGGNNHRRLAQRFIAPKSFTCAAVQVMMKGSPSNTGGIIVEIQTDNAGKPSGTAVTNASKDLSAVISTTHQWQTVEFDGTVSLTAGTVYWLVIREDQTTTNTYYLAADDKGSNDPTSCWTLETGIYGTFKYGSGTKYGTSFSSLWSEQGYLLLTRLISSAEADNDVVLKEAIGWRVVSNKDVAAQELTAQIVNRNYLFSVGQPFYDIPSEPKKIKCYLGFNIEGTGVVYFRRFVGTTESSPVSSDIFELKACDHMKKLLNDSITSQSLGNIAFETMIQNVADHAGISSFDLRTTGKTSRSGIVFQEVSAYNIAERVRQATLDQMSFKNTETLETLARIRPSLSESTVPDYILSDSTFIKDISLEYETDKMINRITITNDENGETSSDGNTLTTGDYQTIGTASGSIAAGTRTQNITITFTEYACIYCQVSDADSDCEITGIDVTCGTSSAYGQMVVSLRNKKYPLAGSYDLTAKGCPISNAGSSTCLAESMNYASVKKYGLYSDRIDNRIFGSVADCEGMADIIIEEKSVPTPRIRANCRGIVDIWPDQAHRFVESRKTQLNHLGIVNLVELNYTNDPKSFEMYIEAEKLDLVGS